MCFVDPVRQCESCADVSRKENEFFDKEIKMLTTGMLHYYKSPCELYFIDITLGALFQLIKLPEENEKHSEFICRLSQDHRLLTFEGSTGEDYEPVELVNISELNLLRSPDIPPGKYY
jgi:hypothetical protein